MTERKKYTEAEEDEMKLQVKFPQIQLEKLIIIFLQVLEANIVIS